MSLVPGLSTAVSTMRLCLETIPYYVGTDLDKRHRVPLSVQTGATLNAPTLVTSTIDSWASVRRHERRLRLLFALMQQSRDVS